MSIFFRQRKAGVGVVSDAQMMWNPKQNAERSHPPPGPRKPKVAQELELPGISGGLWRGRSLKTRSQDTCHPFQIGQSVSQAAGQRKFLGLQKLGRSGLAGAQT